MKPILKMILAAAVLLAATVTNVRAVDVVIPCWRGESGSTVQNWDFRTSANPASPETSSNPYGSPLVTVAPGAFSDGYFASIPGTTNTGWWDLGQSGTLTCVVPNRPSNPTASYKYVWVQVAQYIGGVFPNFAGVVITNATLLSHQQILVTNIPPLGNLYVDQTAWRLEPNPNSENVVVTAPNNGSLVDSVVVDTWCITNANVYVDDDYTSLSSCAAVGWPNGSAPANKYIGQNAYATIQLGVTNAPTNGIVNVANGTYSGNVTVTKNLTLALGPSATNATLNGNLTMTSGSSLPVDLNGLTAGSQYDQWNINGQIALSGANLSVNDTTTFALNSSFTIIKNLGGSAISGAFATLPEGAVITGNFQQFRVTYVGGGSGRDVVLIVTNGLPVAVTDYAATTPNIPVKIPIIKLLLNDFDPDGDTFGFLSAFTAFPTNGSVTVNMDNTVTYTPPLNFSGSNWFTYTIQDSHGGVGTGRVDVLVRPDVQTFNIISLITTNSGASFTVTLAGVPGYTYSLQRSANFNGPWTTIASVSVPSEGITTYYDSSPPPGTGFYRTAYP